MVASAPSTLPRWADLCTTHFATLDPERTVAVLPLGATEQHGPHLPLSVDTTLLEGILAAAAPHHDPSCPVYVLPTQAVGLSPEHARFPGTLTLSAETTLRLWLDIGESVARSGVRKLVVFNTHGGHVGLMDVVGRELRARCDLLVYTSSWFNLPLLDEQGCDLLAQITPEEQRFGIHAGQVETAMMLALQPERVHMAQAQNFPSTSQDRAQRWPLLGNGRSAKLAWQMQDYHPQGAVGNALAATPALGQALVQAAGRALAAVLAEVSALPLSTLVPQPSIPAPDSSL